jgi:hypothetical protein
MSMGEAVRFRSLADRLRTHETIRPPGRDRTPGVATPAAPTGRPATTAIGQAVKATVADAVADVSPDTPVPDTPEAVTPGTTT